MTVYQQRLQQLLNVLKELNPQKVFSYGSRVDGDPKTDSDVDMAVIVDDNADILSLKRKLAVRLWEEQYPYDLEPDIHIIPNQVFNYRLSKGDPFITNVSRGKVVYGF